MTNETHLRINPTTAVKKHITEYIDFLVSRGNLNITEENYLDLSFKLRATAAKYALEDQHKPQPKTTLDIIGDLHTSAAVRKYLNITQEELDKLVEDHLILKLTDGKGRNGYPLFQFTNNTIDPNTQQLIKLYLDHENDPWSTAITLTTPTRAYDENNSSRIEYIRAHPDKYPLVYAQEKHDVKERYYWDGRPNKN